MWIVGPSVFALDIYDAVNRWAVYSIRRQCELYALCALWAPCGVCGSIMSVHVKWYVGGPAEYIVGLGQEEKVMH